MKRATQIVLLIFSKKSSQLGVEIERKFLVERSAWNKVRPENGVKILQGYVMRSPEKTVRIRVKGERGYITLKGKTQGATRSEFEYEIPKSDAEKMLSCFCDQFIDKVRFEIEVDGKIWEVDEFSSPKKGLILAEIELAHESEIFEIPDWVTEDVTHDPSYFNANMLP